MIWVILLLYIAVLPLIAGIIVANLGGLQGIGSFVDRMRGGG